jgi:hypothetical protein
MIPDDTTSFLPDWEGLIRATASTVVAKTFHRPFAAETSISGYFIPYGAGSNFVALGLLDRLEDESTPGEVRQDVNHTRHLTNMNKFAQAKRRPLFVHLASLI